MGKIFHALKHLGAKLVAITWLTHSRIFLPLKDDQLAIKDKRLLDVLDYVDSYEFFYDWLKK